MNITCIQQVQETPVNDVIDIDADNTDPVTVSEYAHEIFVNMKRREVILYNLLRTTDNIDFIRVFNKLYLKVYTIINNEHYQRESRVFSVSISRLTNIFLKVTV